MNRSTTSVRNRRPRRGPWSACVLALALACLCSPAAVAPNDPTGNGFTEYEVKAAFLFRFLSFVEWPVESRPDAGEPLVVAVYGPDPFGDALDPDLHRAALGGRTVEIRHVDDPAELEDCHVVFVGLRDPAEIGKLLSRLRAEPILTVGESELFSRQGGIIRFLEIENRVRFEIEERAVRRSGLKISSKLLRLGVRSD